VQNLVEAGALALAVTVYGLRLHPRRLLRLPRAGPPEPAEPLTGAADAGLGPQNEHRAPVRRP